MRLFFLCAVLFAGSLPIKAENIALNYHQLNRRLAQEKIQSYMRTISGLRQAGSNHLYEAEQLSTFLPEHGGRYIIGTSLGALITALASGSPARVAFTATLAVVGGYVQGCCDRYWEIQDHLETAQRCFEVAESLSAELARKEQDNRWLE